MIRRKQPPVAAENDQPKGFDAFELRLGDIMRGERATLGKSLLDVQRELKIKATYIAAIENADPSAFETPGFIAGYVRSYARYLGLDPEWAYATFCREGNFAKVHGMDAAAASPKPSTAKPAAAKADPLADPNATFVPRGEALLARIEPGAIGSSLVLMALIGALGFGGWSVLKEIQQVNLAPVEQAPGVLAELDPLAGVAMPQADGEEPTGAAAANAAPTPEALDRLYRPQALDVPVLVARDGPISTLPPGAIGALAVPELPQLEVAEAAAEALPEAETSVKVVEDRMPELAIFATRPAWVRVRAADGTVLFEKILDAGENYVLPQTEEPPVLRAGNSGSVYFAVNGEAYGPAARGAQVVKNLVLEQAALKEKFQPVDLAEDPGVATMVAELRAQWQEGGAE
ncbi:helix-turn-helix domain-containing protein [Actibacterium sp. MT2.3-13A]|uniref:helix-turn-helix domain-containing protein n=1 Tax=Actibacterium sp. MT2.3-13A TaxID=2828332 RepID=UPI001BA7710E|nr:helix-turn-helix domain-containing protein [Actibacterium sp. MT2.3-13A]